MKKMFPSTQNSAGFAFSLDAALAIVLIVAFFLVAQQLQQTSSTISSGAEQLQLVDDVFSSIEKSGMIATEIDVNGFSATSMNNIYNRFVNNLPSYVDINLQLTQYLLDVNACRSFQTFTQCFKDQNKTVITIGKLAPAGKEIFDSKKTFLKHQPPSQCSQQAGSKPNWVQPWNFDKDQIAEFANDINFVFDVNILPLGPLQCDQNITVTLAVNIPGGARKAVDMMLVLDRSGSMSWDGYLDTGGANAIDMNTANHVFMARGSPGVEAIDVATPLYPVARDNDDPGTPTDVAVDRNRMFVVETAGTDELKSYDANDVNNLILKNSQSLDSVTGVFAAPDGYVYVAGNGNGGAQPLGLCIFNAVNINSVSFVTCLATTDPRDIVSDKNTVWLADGSAGVRDINVSNKSTPTLQFTLDTNGTAQGLWTDGNYLYVADGSAGVVVMNDSNRQKLTAVKTYDTNGTATNVWGNSAKKELYLADTGSVIIYDMNNPANMKVKAEYATPFSYEDVRFKNPHLLLSSSNLGYLITFDENTGPKINQLKTASNTFVDFNGWKKNKDQLGLVTYSSTATTNQDLNYDFNLTRTKIQTLVASGSTATGDAINAATTELTSVRHKSNSVKFQVVMTDGVTNTGASTSSAATNAKNNGIVIYTVGFGGDVNGADLNNIANITGGQYYFVSDQNSLQAVYTLIAQNIQALASDSNLSVQVGNNATIIDANGGTITADGNLLYDVNLQKYNPWQITYKLNFPCNVDSSCTSTVISFPGVGTYFSYIDENNNTQKVDWNNFTTVQFEYRDLNVNIQSGSVIGQSQSSLDVNVGSIGYLPTGVTQVDFYNGDPDLNGKFLDSQGIPALCGLQDPLCAVSYERFTKTVNAQGELYAVVNRNKAISECPAQDKDVLYCYGNTTTQFYVLEVKAWKK